jgi:hypothetical protein
MQFVRPFGWNFESKQPLKKIKCEFKSVKTSRIQLKNL